MKRFRDLSIRTKLTAAILAITTLCLSIALTALGLQRASAFRDDMRDSITLVANVIAESSVADLAFDDRVESAKTLERLRISPEIESAALYDAEGELFSTYRKPGSPVGDAPAARVDVSRGAETRFAGGQLEVYVPVVYEGSRYGLIHITASTVSLGARTRQYFATLAGLVAVLLVLTLLFAWAVQRVISRPILHLARAARTIADGEAPSYRAAETSRDEIGTLAKGFNTMLEHLERRQRELGESSDTLRALIETCPLAIIAVDRNLDVTLWNAAAERIFGVGELEAVGRPVAQLIAARGAEEVWLACRTGEAVKGLELTWSRPGGGGALELAVVAVPLVSGAAHQGSMILAEDITERKQVQAALREREVQLQRMQKMDAVGRLAGGVSHDFNNLLSIIILSARLAGRYFHDQGKLTGELDTILATARRGSALTRRLLAFSAPKRVNPEVVDINGIIADVSKMLRLVIGEDLQFVTELSDAPCHVVVDPGQVEQVLLNLVINARDAMPRGGRLELRTEVIEPDARPAEGSPASGAAGTVRLQATDSGCGMNPETAARVFEPFFTTKPHGTGLGLATVHGIVTQSGGEITVASREGAGTTFTILLPRQVAGPASAADVVAQAPSVGGTTILLVEDEPRLRRVARQLLEDEGHTVIEAENGVAALARCRTLSRPVDLLLTDVVMPEMGGPRLAQELLKRYPHLPVLYMSGYHGAALASEQLELATFPILAKPFGPEDLIRKVNEILEAQPGRPARAVERGGRGGG